MVLVVSDFSFVRKFFAALIHDIIVTRHTRSTIITSMFIQ